MEIKLVESRFKHKTKQRVGHFSIGVDKTGYFTTGVKMLSDTGTNNGDEFKFQMPPALLQETTSFFQ